MDYFRNAQGVAVMLAVVLSGCTPYVPPPAVAAPSVRSAPVAMASAAPVPVAPQSEAFRYHRVIPGETLWSISKRYGVNLKAIAQASRLQDLSRIHAGQRLTIPAQAPSRRLSGPVSVVSESFGWPVHGKVISIFGMKQGGRVNKGVDIQAAEGADVLATRSGRVSFIHEEMPGFGKTVIIDHEDGFASVYAYIGRILVQQGQPVRKSDVIARVGRTGRTQVAALHFEIRRNQKPENPLYYLP